MGSLLIGRCFGLKNVGRNFSGSTNRASLCRGLKFRPTVATLVKDDIAFICCLLPTQKSGKELCE